MGKTNVSRENKHMRGVILYQGLEHSRTDRGLGPHLHSIHLEHLINIKSCLDWIHLCLLVFSLQEATCLILGSIAKTKKDIFLFLFRAFKKVPVFF